MTDEKNKRHWRQGDRIESLIQIITGLNNSINLLKKQIDEINWYDGDWFAEEAEPIYGLAFIAFQNYVVGCIKDSFDTTRLKFEYFRLVPNMEGFEKSSIELIITLANYSKHKDEGIYQQMQENLKCFKLKWGDDIETDESPIFEGLSLLSERWDLFEILKIVTDWEERLWRYRFENTPQAYDGV
jgi:hypothetical protein